MSHTITSHHAHHSHQIRIPDGTLLDVLMIVKDPSRIFLGTPGDFNEITGGKTLPEMLSATNAVGGINAGGFLDESGKGNGAVPMGLVIDNGELIWGYKELSYNVVGFDDNYILHVGYMTGQQALNRNLRYAVSMTWL